MKRVALGMSGGLDSTMTALILMDAGYEVIGITMSTWDPSLPIKDQSRRGCFGPGEPTNLESAVKAAQLLGIEHHIIKLQSEFRAEVLDYFCSTYEAGQTPNPCARCNPYIKFGALPQKARDLGLDFDYFATGHYLRKTSGMGRVQLRKALDKSKDQSYFLCFLSQEQLATSLFPLGDYTKAELREYAASRGFEYLAKKKESQDFLQTDDYTVLFKEQHPGDLVDHEGRILGRHRGLIHYTIGQRRNLGIAGMPEPYYVIGIDASANRVIVGPESYLYSDTAVVHSANWLSIAEPNGPFRAEVKIRLAHQTAACTLSPMPGGEWSLHFDEAQLSITPGQVAAFYDDDLLLGGAIIGRVAGS